MKESAVMESMEKVKNIDKQNMLSLLLGVPQYAQEALERVEKAGLKKLTTPVRQIIISGLGGSAIGGDLVKAYVWNSCSVPIFVNREYTLPAFTGSETLFIACSYSGDTEETLSSFEEALKKKTQILSVSSGGRLIALSKEKKIPFVQIPAGFPPRCALGYLFFSLLGALNKLGLVQSSKEEIAEALSLLREMAQTKLNPEVPVSSNPAKELAQLMHNKFPLIYSGQTFGPVATRWRTQLNENAKVLASTHIFPELNHNEIVGWEFPRELLKQFVPIYLTDGGDHPRVKRRMAITKTILEREVSVKVTEVPSLGKGLLARMFSLIYIGDFASFYLALLNGVDPTPVERIRCLKGELAKL